MRCASRYMVTAVLSILLVIYLLYNRRNIIKLRVREDQDYHPSSGRHVETVSNTDSGIVFYNRVGKCGSRSIVQLASSLARRNNFTRLTSRDRENDHPNPEDADIEMKKIASFKPRTFYDRHVHFLDFEAKGLRKPIYINLIRDPVERFSSQYNYWKYGDGIGMNHPMELPDINDCVAKNLSTCHSPTMFYISNFFCGLDDKCLDRYSPERVEIAKKHIDKDYLVIGILEEFETTLILFEKMLPGYFGGAVRLWKAKQDNMRRWAKTRRLDILTEESKEKLKREYLVHEYIVYNHAKRKFDELKVRYNLQ